MVTKDPVITSWDIVNWKVFILVILIYIIISSDIFTDNVLSGIKGATIGDKTTTYGATICGLIMGFSYLLFQPLATYGYI